MPQQKVWKINGSTFLYTLLLLTVQVQKTDTETVHYRAVQLPVYKDQQEKQNVTTKGMANKLQYIFVHSFTTGGTSTKNRYRESTL